ncbi:MAG: hypothetical protein JWO20_2941 [Candidatus Angelobacter sp.]|nr:hypothetical protein [Candidatus Angelobacter sp.]
MDAAGKHCGHLCGHVQKRYNEQLLTFISILDDYMLAGATVFITIVLALFFGILSGWAALAAILYAFGSRKELKANPSAVALGSRAHAR